MRTRLLAGALLVIVVVGCAGTSFDVLSRQEDGFDFKGKNTYKWLEIPANQKLPTTVADYDASDRVIRQTFDRHMEDRGFKTADDPDYRVTYWVQVQENITAGRYSDTYGNTGAWDPDLHSGRFVKGALVLDVIDTASNDLVWRGTALADFTPGKGDKILDEAVARILDEFPDR